uniref:Uncharacterized protein n=1 Tax=Oryza nivara TaxID=4536 RepID=A0A0E0GM56_ORYNI
MAAIASDDEAAEADRCGTIVRLPREGRCPFYLTTLWLQSVPSHILPAKVAPILRADAEPSSGNAGSGTLSPDWPRSRAGRLQLAVAQPHWGNIKFFTALYSAFT